MGTCKLKYLFFNYYEFYCHLVGCLQVLLTVEYGATYKYLEYIFTKNFKSNTLYCYYPFF